MPKRHLPEKRALGIDGSFTHCTVSSDTSSITQAQYPFLEFLSKESQIETLLMKVFHLGDPLKVRVLWTYKRGCMFLGLGQYKIFHCNKLSMYQINGS